MIALTRLHLRHELKRAKSDGDVERVNLLKVVLDDSDILSIIHQANEAEYDYAHAQVAASDHIYGGGLQDFLRWLFEHREQIFKLILQIVQLLSILEPSPSLEGREK